MIKYDQVLYGPTIEIDDSWIKTAALYYGKVNRIVPEGIKPTDSKILRELNEKIDLVHDLKPTHQEKIEREFLNYACDVLSKIEMRRQLNIALGDIEGYSIPIYRQKLTYNLLTQLESLGLAKASRDHNIYKLDAITGSMYMGFLSKAMAESRALPIVTSSNVFHNVLQSFNGTHEDIGFKLASIVISSFVPANIEDVSVEKIVKFRQTYTDERLAFYHHINELINDIGNVESDDALREILFFKKSKIDKCVQDIEEAGQGIGLKMIRASLSLIQAIVSGNNLGSFSAGIDTLGAALENKQAKSSGMYVLALRDELQKKDLAQQLLTRKLIL